WSSDVCSSDLRNIPRTRNPPGQHFPGNACNRLLAGRIDIEHKHGVCVRKSIGELLQQRLRAGIAVRLEYNVYLSVVTLPRSGKSRLDLGGMMPVIVNDGHPCCMPAQLESPIHPPEAVQRTMNVLD